MEIKENKENVENDKLLELVMIVKNSGEILRRCLQSFTNYIDHWTIVDTGSTDNTPDIIKEELSKIPGNLYYHDFVDFSNARNKAFELSDKSCKYQIIVDDSYVLHGGKNLLHILKKSKKDAYSIKIGVITDLNILSDFYYSMRIVKSDINVKYVGRVHEVIKLEDHHKDDHLRSNNIFLEDLPDKNHAMRSSNRYKKDVVLLQEDLKDDQDNSRTILHLIKTLFCIYDYKNAIYYLKKLEKVSNIEEYSFFAKKERYMLEFLEYEKSELYGNKEKVISLMMNLFFKYTSRQGEIGFVIASLLNENNNNNDKIILLLDSIITQQKPELYLTNVNSIIYEYFIPYLYIEANLKAKRIDKAVKTLQDLLKKFPTHQPLLNIKYALCDQDLSKIIKIEQKVIVIHMGTFFYAWNPLNNTEISGSEYMAINMSREFTKLGYRVFVFGFFEGKDKYGKQVNYECIDTLNKGKIIQYIDKSKFQLFCENYYIDYLIVSRDINNIVYYDNIKSVYLWLHDVLPLNHELPLQINPEKFKGIITLTKWHTNFVKNKLGCDPKYMITSRNAIYPERFLNKNIKKIPYQFIYSSDPMRGLDNLIPLIKRIKGRYPETTLKIYTRINCISEKLLEDILECKDYIFLNDRVDQETISNELLSSDIWLYPTDFKETYCISCLEAMMAECLVATVKLAALQDICAENRGVLVDDPYNEDEMYKKLSFVLDRPELKQMYIENARKFAEKQTFRLLANDWNDFFN